MKYFIAIALIAAVASAGITKPIDLDLATAEMAEVQEIIAAINSPSTDPATAAALEQLLQQVLGISQPEPIAVGPAIVEETHEVPSIEPAIIDFPIPESALAPTPVAPAPVAPAPVAPAPESSSPLVQIIVNVQQSQSGPVIGSPVIVDGVEEAIIPGPAIVPDVHDIIPSPVAVIEEAFVPEPVNVIESFPVAPEPVLVAPVIVSPAVMAPEILN